MSDSIKIRPAKHSELPDLARLVAYQLPNMMDGQPRPESLEHHLAQLIPDDALILAIRSHQLAGLIALDLDHSQVLACYLDPQRANRETPRALFRAAETLAISYGIRRLKCRARQRLGEFMTSLGYQPGQANGKASDGRLEKDLLARAKPKLLELIALLDSLGLPADYGIRHRMRLVPEAKSLSEAGRDIFGRDQRLVPAATSAWIQMQTAAAGNGIVLELISAYRSVSYQANLLRRKLQEGQSMSRILNVSAAPGYSEHHSGRAIDLTTPGVEPLTEDFAKTKAYQWLKENAPLFGFQESYPHNNRNKIAWEPWHWCYHVPRVAERLAVAQS